MLVIDYPVKPQHIVMLGKPERFARSFTIRPLREGHFSMIVSPKNAMRNDDFFRFDISFQNLNSAPQRIEISIPPRLHSSKAWQWKLIRWPDYLQFDPNTDESKQILSTSELAFLHLPEAVGQFTLTEANAYAPHTLLMWSCNQPFTTSDNKALLLEETTTPVLEWYAQQAKSIQPDLVWVLGDAAYSDGTEASNFIDAYYDNPSWATNPQQVEHLSTTYRAMYRGHWSFPPLQQVMRNFPHLCVWDDHEIRDGWGSEADDFKGHNRKIYEVARSVAEEYILNNGPRVRNSDKDADADAHQAYFEGNIAAFIFDGRSSRRYHDQQGHVISEAQFQDFIQFCENAANNPQTKFLLMGCGVPFINLKDFVEILGSKAPKALTDMMAGIRDDVRDSWHSPGNKAALKRLITVLRKLHYRRSDIDIINISGDIHVANAFTFQPIGFRKALYQVTSSALTNRQHLADIGSALLSVGTEAHSDVLGIITRLWEEVTDPNMLVISNHGENLRFELKVYDLDVESSQRLKSPKDKTLDVGAHSLTQNYVIK